MKSAAALAVILFCLISCGSPNPAGQDHPRVLMMDLKDGWTYAPGDDTARASLLYDDSHWLPIQPQEDIYTYLDRNPGPHTAWLRLKFTVPATWPQEQLALTVVQSVASEIFLDGKPVAQYGTIDPGAQRTSEHDPHLKPIPFNAIPGSQHLLAVRMGVSGRARYTTLFEMPNPVFQAELKPIDTAIDVYRYFHANETGFISVLIGINLMIFILHGFFFLMNPAQRANLFIALSGLFYIVGYLIQSRYFLHSPNPTDRYVLGNLTFVLFQMSNWMLFLTINAFLDRRKDIFFWLLAAYFVVSTGMNLFWYDQGWRMGGAIFQILTWLNILRICLSSRKEGRKGATVFAIGAIISILFFIWFVLQGTFNVESDYLLNLSLFRQLTYMIAWLGITGSLSAFLAWDFSQTSKQLSRKLSEVKELSDRNIAIEKEKQEILAAQNLQLEEKVRERTSELNRSLENLKATQAQLVQSEKMASLGELTAGIAHEIQNPLNFVNNFSDLNSELIDELQEELKKGDIREASSIAENLKDNEAKINLHGKRADGIVKSMLQHSRASGGQKEPTDINQLVDEYVRLAYHGYRARKKDFNVKLDIQTDPHVGKVNIVAQDIGRVLLNLLNNAFQAVEEKSKTAGTAYQPTVTVSTSFPEGVPPKADHPPGKESANALMRKSVIVCVADNGPGIPDSIKEKIFQPFFTTKPTGQGTGLGLSLSYDIVAKGHGGELIVDTTEKTGASFTIRLPIQ